MLVKCLSQSRRLGHPRTHSDDYLHICTHAHGSQEVVTQDPFDWSTLYDAVVDPICLLSAGAREVVNDYISCCFDTAFNGSKTLFQALT